jgi:catechol 2,3-dioxygenase-like lactoylglutathione lyase family enzyme
MVTIQKMDHVGIIVDDLPAAKAFFVDLGFEVHEEDEVAGEWVERIIGLDNVKLTMAYVGLPNGQGNLELITFQTPAAERRVQPPLANTPGIRHIAFIVDDIEAIVAKLRAQGTELVGEIQNAQDTYKLCYVRGPEGIILELAEQLT